VRLSRKRKFLSELSWYFLRNIIVTAIFNIGLYIHDKVNDFIILHFCGRKIFVGL